MDGGERDGELSLVDTGPTVEQFLSSQEISVSLSLS